MSALSFPSVGQSSTAYTFSFTVGGTTGVEDVVLALKGSTVMGLVYADVNSVEVTVVEGFTTQALAKISPATTKANGSGTTKPKPTSHQVAGSGSYTYSYKGSTGTVKVPTAATDPAVVDIEAFRQAAGQPPVTYVVANVNNVRGADSVKMYQVVIVTKTGNQVEFGRIDTMIGNWDEQLGTSNVDLYNNGIELQNENDTFLLPGAKGTDVLGTDETIGSVARVYVYPNGGFDRVQAKKK